MQKRDRLFRRINRMKKNIYNIVFTVFLFTIFITGCSATPELGSTADMSGYDGLADKTNHVFIVSDAKDFLMHMDSKETYVAYFGFDTCPGCNAIISILNNLGKDYNQEILYINTRPNKKVTANNQIDNYDQLFSKIGNYWSIDPETGENYMYVPFVVFVKDGSIVVSQMGYVNGTTYGVPDTEIPEDQNDALIHIYRTGFEKISS